MNALEAQRILATKKNPDAFEIFAAQNYLAALEGPEVKALVEALERISANPCSNQNCQIRTVLAKELFKFHERRGAEFYIKE